MTWIKLDDRAPRHPKIAGLSDRAFRWWVLGLCYASEFLTDGVLPVAFVRTVPRGTVSELKACGLWRDSADAIVIHDYLAYQSSREYVESERAFNGRRAAMNRDPELRTQIQARDGNKCRYCGCRVSWTDRRSPTGATYDHVVPRGPETADNLVVACRRCNGKKGQRTPDQAGMVLLPVGNCLELSRHKPEPEIRDQRSETEERNTHTPRVRATAAGPLAGTLPRDHVDHGFCGQFCVTEKTLAGLVRQFNPREGEDGRGLVVAFLQSLSDGLQPGQSHGGHLWMQRHFEAWLVTQGRIAPSPAVKAPTLSPVEAFKARQRAKAAGGVA